MEPSIRDEYQHMSTFFYFIVTTKGDLHEIENINYFFFFYCDTNRSYVFKTTSNLKHLRALLLLLHIDADHVLLVASFLWNCDHHTFSTNFSRNVVGLYRFLKCHR